MLKFLVPLLLASTVAYADNDSFKFHHHFDAMAPSWDGTIQTMAPQIKAAIPAETPKIGSRCTTDDLKTVSSYLHSIGYTALVVAHDSARDNVQDEIMYNMNDNSILSLSMYYEKPLTDDEDKDSNKMVKLCTEFQGKNAYGDGKAFQKFVLGQHMAEQNLASDNRDDFMRKSSKGEIKDKDGDPVHEEPYQGDPSRINYIPLN